MALKINNALRTKIVDSGIVGQFGTAILKIYDGTQPTNAGDAATGNMIVQINGIIWNAATNGTAAITGTKTGTAGTTGTAAWGRLSGTDGTSYILDGGCGTAAANTFVIDSVSIAAEAVVSLTAATIIQPAS